jgi:hypothetical protein
MAKSNITVDVISNLFSLCSVKCDNFSCVHRNQDTNNCNLKHIEIDVAGKCENYRTANMMA